MQTQSQSYENVAHGTIVPNSDVNQVSNSKETNTTGEVEDVKLHLKFFRYHKHAISITTDAWLFDTISTVEGISGLIDNLANWFLAYSKAPEEYGGSMEESINNYQALIEFLTRLATAVAEHDSNQHQNQLGAISMLVNNSLSAPILARAAEEDRKVLTDILKGIQEITARTGLYFTPVDAIKL